MRGFKLDSTSIEEVMNVMREFFPSHASIAIADTKEFIFYQPSNQIDLHIQNGDLVKEGTATHKALSTGKKVTEFIDPSVFGIPYYGMSMPIREDGKIKGAVTAILPEPPSSFLTNYLTIKKGECWYPVKQETVLFLETQFRKTLVKTDSIEGYHRLNLSELELFLSPTLFVRCHRSYIVNIDFIDEIQPDSHSTFLLIMKNGTRIPVSQRYASYFRRSLGF